MFAAVKQRYKQPFNVLLSRSTNAALKFPPKNDESFTVGNTVVKVHFKIICLDLSRGSNGEGEETLVSGPGQTHETYLHSFRGSTYAYLDHGPFILA